MTLNYLLKNWVNNELRCRLCARVLFFSFPLSLFSERVTAPPPILLRPQLLFNSGSDAFVPPFFSFFFFARLMPTVDSVSEILFKRSILADRCYYCQQSWENGFSPFGNVPIEEVFLHTWLCYILAATRRQGFDSKGPSEARTQCSVKRLKK